MSALRGWTEKEPDDIFVLCLNNITLTDIVILALTIQESLPNDADDLIITDARRYSWVGCPDMGVYEKGGIAP